MLDLFSGIGGFSLGLHWAGCRTIAFCEADPFAQSILRRHWPSVPIYADIRTLSAARLTADGIALPTMLVGGFPCQDISAAGRGAGLDGQRSRLWHDMAWLIAECRPCWLVVENVPALRVRGADQIMEQLEALGYACWPMLVGAGHAAAPHRRQRVWIVGRLAADAQGTGLADGHGGPAQPAAGLPAERSCGWPVEPGIRRVGDGFSARLDRKRRITALGNAAVPDVAAMIGRAILAIGV